MAGAICGEVGVVGEVVAVGEVGVAGEAVVVGEAGEVGDGFVGSEGFIPNGIDRAAEAGAGAEPGHPKRATNAMAKTMAIHPMGRDMLASYGLEVGAGNGGAGNAGAGNGGATIGGARMAATAGRIESLHMP